MIFALTAVVALHLGAFRVVDSVWHTDGEVVHEFTRFLLIAFSCLSVLLWLSGPKRAVVILTLASLAPFLLRQTVLQYRLEGLREEVLRMAAYVERQRKETGEYPPDISGYTFERSAYEARIRYWPIPDDPSWYIISYKLYVGDNTSREYSPRGWYYYPD